MSDTFARSDHDLRISNLRTALSLERKPADLARLHKALDHELAQCDRLGCTKPLLSAEAEKP
jgi:hypothetical protein